MSYEIRLATQADIPAIQRLMAEFPTKLLRRSDKEILELLETFWVLVEDGEIVGCGCLEIYGPKIAEIRSVAVRHDRQGKGYGRRLIMKAVEEGQRRGIPEIMLVTSTPSYFQRLNFGTCLDEKYAMFWNGTSPKEQ